MKEYHNTDSIKKHKTVVKAFIFKNGVPLGTWTGTDFEFSQLQLAVSSTQLSFSVIEHGLSTNG